MADDTRAPRLLYPQAGYQPPPDGATTKWMQRPKRASRAGCQVIELFPGADEDAARARAAIFLRLVGLDGPALARLQVWLDREAG